MHKWSKNGNISSLCIFEKFTRLGNANVNGYKYLFERIGTMIK